MLPLLDPSMPLGRVAEHVRLRWRQHQRVELELSLGLRRLFRDNVHRGAGHGNFASYAQAEFDIPPKLAWTFSILGQHLERLPLLVAAMARGEVTWTKAREFAPYIEPQHQEDWIEFARTHTNREVELKVGRWNAVRQGKEFVEKKKVTSRLDGLETQAVRQAREQLLRVTKEFVPEEKLLPVMAKLFVAGQLNTAGGEVVGRGLPSTGPYVSIHACPGCLTTFVPVPGANMPVAAFEFLGRLRKAGSGQGFVNLVRHYFCDCGDALHRRDECPRQEPEVAVPEEPVSRYLPVEVRRMIEARDGFRCSVPGCLNQLPLEGGHLKAFAENGPPTATNLATQCQTCNALIREGRLRVVGVAPYEKYYLADGTFVGWGYDPTPFPFPGDAPGQDREHRARRARGSGSGSGSGGGSGGGDSDPGVSHMGHDDGGGRIAESPPIWGIPATPAAP